MSYSGRVDNIRINESNDKITLSVHNPQAWDNELDTTSITFARKSINNLVECLKEIQAAKYRDW